MVVYRDPTHYSIKVQIIHRIEELLRDQRSAMIGIDIPIGLPDHYSEGGRECDRLARKLLGPKRGSSVFPCPARPTLAATSHEEASRLNRESSAASAGISKQCFEILPKIREVDEVLTPELQSQVIEVHPELCFYELNGQQPLLAPKKSREGRSLRIFLLERAWNQPLAEIVEQACGPNCARDDVIDAMAACWTAERIMRGEAISTPSSPDVDSRGIRMEIVR